MEQALITRYGTLGRVPEPFLLRSIRTLKGQRVHCHRFESQQHALRVVGDWIQFHNHRRPHQALGMKTPTEAYALAA